MSDAEPIRNVLAAARAARRILPVASSTLLLFVSACGAEPGSAVDASGDVPPDAAVEDAAEDGTERDGATRDTTLPNDAPDERDGDEGGDDGGSVDDVDSGGLVDADVDPDGAPDVDVRDTADDGEEDASDPDTGGDASEDAADGGDADGEDADAGDDDAGDAASEDAPEEDVYDEDADPECRAGAWCGRPPVCCAAGNECVAEECLPRCDTGVRCGADRELCCDAGDVCLEQACVPPRGVCEDSLDCETGEFCEPTLGRCLPQSDDVTCEVVPDFTDIAMDVDWSWEEGEVISIPVVADVRGNGTPDVIVNVARVGGGDWPVGEVLALDGTDGSELWRIAHAPAEGRWGSHGRSTFALGDVNGDGLPDILYAGRPETGGSRIVAVDGEGRLLWTSHDGAGQPVRFNVENGAVTVANFDDDPEAELVVGASLIDHDGRVVWNQGGDGPNFGTNGGYRGGIAVVADLDGDGRPEIVTGRHAWKVNVPGASAADAVVTEYWESEQPDGYPAVADFDGDGVPEVVLVGSRSVSILDGRTGQAWCARAACGAANEFVASALLPGGASSNRGGPPTIADFDGDGRPEIGVAGGYSYVVYDVARPGEEAVPPGVEPGQLFIRWEQTTRDRSSNATGSSVFDFNGDGAAEVVYADECFLRVYDGPTGRVLIEIPNSNGTIHEYPIVVDVDGDGRSEILVTANTTGSGSNCNLPGYTARKGLFVYGDPANAWLRTRRVWTQHAYHVTNATSAGNVPTLEEPNWLNPALNNARQNVQGEGVYNAADLSVESFGFNTDGCVMGELGVVARISNTGSLGAPAGVPVRFYQGDDASGVLLGTRATTERLLPGQETRVEWTLDLPPRGERRFYVEVDAAEPGTPPVVECDETNNTAFAEMDDCFGY